MIYLLDGNYETVGYLDGDACKDLNYKVLGYIKRDASQQELNYIQNLEHETLGYIQGDEIRGKNYSAPFGYVNGNDVQTSDRHTIGHIKINDTQDTKDRTRAGAVLFWFFNLSAFY